MTYLSYQLPKGAPVRIVWFAQCDVCMGFLPNPTKETTTLRVQANRAGWHYASHQPCDTCPECRKDTP